MSFIMLDASFFPNFHLSFVSAAVAALLAFLSAAFPETWYICVTSHKGSVTDVISAKSFYCPLTALKVDCKEVLVLSVWVRLLGDMASVECKPRVKTLVREYIYNNIQRVGRKWGNYCKTTTHSQCNEFHTVGVAAEKAHLPSSVRVRWVCSHRVSTDRDEREDVTGWSRWQCWRWCSKIATKGF